MQKNSSGTVQEYYEHRQRLIASVRDALGDPDWHPGQTGELALMQSLIDNPDFLITEETVRTLAQIDAALGDHSRAMQSPFAEGEAVHLEI